MFRVTLADNVVFRPEQREILALAELRDPRTGDMARVGNANLLFEPNLQLIEKCGIIPARALVDGSTVPGSFQYVYLTPANRQNCTRANEWVL